MTTQLPAATPPNPSIRFVSEFTNPAQAHVEVSGVIPSALAELRRAKWTTAQWQQLFAVHTEPEGFSTALGLPAMAGDYRVEEKQLLFFPKYGLVAGVAYRAFFNPAKLPQASGTSAVITAQFRVPSRSTNATTVVSAIYPSADLLPENLLKFYVHFSAPMSRGHIYDHIHLKSDSGKDVELPFLEIDEELWDPEMKRLTLFIDPGRIKRGVQPLEEVGPALQDGHRFTLVIDQGWQDAQGNPIREAFRKSFAVGPPNRRPPDPKEWKVNAPQAGTRQALAVVFPDPMDHALALRMIRVGRDKNETINGTAALTEQEKRWTFVPEAPWKAGAYYLGVTTTIEDLAGNNIGKPFEVDLFDTVQRRLSASTVKVPFEVGH